MHPTTLLLGSGYTLQRVATKLACQSFVATSRSAETVSLWQKQGWFAEVVDLANPASLRELFKKYPAITRIVDSVPPERNSEDPAHLVKAAISHYQALPNLEKIFYLSTTGVYGVDDGSWVDEQTSTHPDTPTGKARLLIEDEYRRSGLPVVVLRLPGIYGPGRGIEASLTRGSYRLIGDGLRWTNRIHVEDLSDVIVAALEKKVPPLLCVSDDSPTLAKDVAAFFCDKMKLPFPACISLEQAREERLYTMLGNRRVSNKLMKESFQIKLKYPSFRSAFEV